MPRDSVPESCTGTQSADSPVPVDQGEGTGRVVSPRVRVRVGELPILTRGFTRSRGYAHWFLHSVLDYGAEWCSNARRRYS